jgi:hypothetical protein
MQTNYLTRDKYGMYASEEGLGLNPGFMGLDTLVGNAIFNAHGEELGVINDFMVEMATGTISYALVSFNTASDLGEKLFAVPWRALLLDANRHRFLLHVTKEALKDAPGFHKDHWPSLGDLTWSRSVHHFYGTTSAA